MQNRGNVKSAKNIYKHLYVFNSGKINKVRLELFQGD